MNTSKATSWEFGNETKPHLKARVVQFSKGNKIDPFTGDHVHQDHIVEIDPLREIPGTPAVLREWAEVLMGAAQQLEVCAS